MIIFWQSSSLCHFFILLPGTILWMLFAEANTCEAPISIAVSQPSSSENILIIQLLLDSGCWIIRKHVRERTFYDRVSLTITLR